MRRHRFEPAALVMGLVLITLTVFFLLDAGGVWDLRPSRSVPLAGGGLVLAAAAGIVTQAVRSARARRARRRP
ncbi:MULTISPECIES: hypothetical protein [unclassified Streptomyces]|uniref:hypothetical protein n=1 Tax=unclassified Streptomyces TaxID=2593676 RepID=UPI002E32278E|nr:hypothetical protein [Streptomyces sp. NBC_01477]